MKPFRLFFLNYLSNWKIILTLWILFGVYISGIFAAFWLAFLGHFSHIGLGFIIAISMPFFYSFISLPTLFFLNLMEHFSSKNLLLSLSFGFANIVFSNILIILWILLVFNLFLSKHSSSDVVPLFIWVFFVSLGPIDYMSKKEKISDVGAFFGLIFSYVSFFSISIMWFTFGFNLLFLVIIILVFSIIHFVFFYQNFK
jgi:hypothetical protein